MQFNVSQQEPCGLRNTHTHTHEAYGLDTIE